MKKEYFFRAMTVFAVAALLFAGCDTPAENDVADLKTLSGSITISPSTGVTTGTEMTAIYSGSETVTYQWKKGGSAITGAVQTTYTPPEAGSYTVTVSAADYNPKTSAAVTVTGETLPALTGTLTISGNAVVGRTLTATTSALNGNGTFAYQWKRGDTAAAVTTDIPGANGQTYTLTEADNGRYIALSATRSGNSGSVISAAAGPVTDQTNETAVPGADLSAKLTWLKDYAESNSAYLITIDKAETLAGADSNSNNYLSYDTYTGEGNITIRLTGGRAISLSSDGLLFEIGNGVTLILDKIALYGRVQVKSGGALEMGTGAKITGNATYYGGVSVGNGGIFTMNGGEISGNTLPYYDPYGNPLYGGGGVYVSGGTFTMSGGKISGNTVTYSYRSSGGVYVSGGTFTMSGGEISGNTVSGYGGGVSVSGGTFTMSGGEISSNTVNTSNNNYGGGGGVYVSGGTFTKTGGTITGYGDDTQNGNVVKDSSGVVQSDRGHAVFVNNIFDKRKENTLGPGVALDSTKFGTAGGWDDNITFTPLTANTWADGNIATGGEQWFKFTATASTQYIHAIFETLNLLSVQVYNSSGATVGGQTISTSYISQSVTVGQEYYIRVRPYHNSDSGTYRIAFNATPSPPGTAVTTLTANIWADGNIPTSNGEQWFKFTATASTQYIHASLGTLSELYVQVYNSSGDTVGGQTISTNYISQSVTVGQEYYIRVRPRYDSESGTYRIAFNTMAMSPDATATTLTVNTWADGNIATGGEQWFKFTATASTQYIHASLGTLTELYVQVMTQAGVTIGSQTNLYGSNKYTSRSVIVGQDYYIRVSSYSSGSGTYRIAFNTISMSPDATATTFTVNTWADGSIATGGEQWFKFTATASTQYIHASFETLTVLYVQVYNYSSGNTVGYETELYNSNDNKYISRSVTVGQEYYVRVRPYSSNSGTYRIAFNATPFPPGTTVTTLTANIWADGNIATGGEQWFKFTATASMQYIHVSFGTLTQLYVQVYNSSGTTIGYETELYSSNKYTSHSVTGGQDYYVRVSHPYYSSVMYQIAFNEYTTAPSL
jgi:hypothetical protein